MENYVGSKSSVHLRMNSRGLTRGQWQLGSYPLSVTGGADLGEQPVRLAELPLAVLLVAALTRQLGELDVDNRLVGPPLGVAHHL